MYNKIAIKELSDVEVNSWASNQHEFHGVTALKNMFGYARQYFLAEFYYINKNGTEGERGELTWYDARENSFNRTEYRLYYTANSVVPKAHAGDTLMVCLCDNGVVKVIIIEKETQLVDFILSTLKMNIGNTYNFVEQDKLAKIETLLE